MATHPNALMSNLGHTLLAVELQHGTHRLVGFGVVTWKLSVEPMSAAAGREEIAAGALHWSIQWDRRERRRHG